MLQKNFSTKHSKSIFLLLYIYLFIKKLSFLTYQSKAINNGELTFFSSSVSIGVTTGGTFCGVVGNKNRHEYSGMPANYWNYQYSHTMHASNIFVDKLKCKKP